MGFEATSKSSSSSSSTDKLIKQVIDLVKAIQSDIKILIDNNRPPPPPPIDHGCAADQVWDEAQQKCVPKPVVTVPPMPTEGIKKSGGNQDANTWVVVKMHDNPLLSKVVDDKVKNIATDFTSDTTAQGYIDYYKYIQNNPIPEPPPPPPPPPPDTHGCTANQHWDEATQTCIDNPPPVTGGPTDLHGITKIFDDFPLKADQSFFSQGADWANDSRLFLRGTVKQISPGVFEGVPTSSTNPPTLRINVKTTNPKAADEAYQGSQARDWTKMAARVDSDGVWRGGWMVGPEDFRNTELTEYYKVVKDGGDENTHYNRGGHHGSGDYSTECGSVCIKQQVKSDLSARAAKEYTHVNSPQQYAWRPINSLFNLKSEIGQFQNALIGQKTIFYNVMSTDGKKVESVIMETWLDLASKDLPKPDFTKQNWKLWAVSIDRGDWPKAGDTGYVSGCHATDAQMLITWGGPICTTRLDNSTKQFYTFSVREIDPVKRLVGVMPTSSS